MTTFTIDTHNKITANASPEEAAAAPTTPFDSFSSQPEFAELAKSWPAKRLVAIWSSLPGVQPVKKFKDHKAGARRIWERIQGLGALAQPAPPAQPKAARQAKRGARAGPGSKTAQVVAMLQRKNGATLSEIMQSMGWQKHTVRGFMAGAMKKAGHAVESFKPEGGERTYRIK